MLEKATRLRLEDAILRSAYFEDFCENDKRVRDGLDMRTYIDGCSHIIDSAQLSLLESYLKTSGIMSENIDITFLLFNRNHEGGMPHTHGKFIMLPDDWFLRSLSPEQRQHIIKHESIHIYQRYNPCEFNQKLLSNNAFYISGYRKKESNIRSNPDINKIVYSDIRAIYKDEPKSLGDISDYREHPYEIFAYEHQ
jgi:hypothetical protein